ncbi:MAG: hypothetical protein Q7R33_05945, partial [Nitrosarchaeum sp.]|nr:hypothetical protein [Nitrosarchaeum sp.]
LPIMNPGQLKQFLFERIKNAFNRRVEKHELNYNHISPDMLSKVKIKLYKSITSSSDTDGDFKENSGQYRLYPRGVRCSKCGDFILLDEKTMRITKNGRCQHKLCNGVYRQISIVKFCETCGKLDEMYDRCQKHEEHKKSGTPSTIKLRWDRQDAPVTWRLECDTCHNPKDILQIPCNHKDYNSFQISKLKPSKYKPLSIRSGGVVTPRVVTTVDIPPTKSLDHPKREQLICAAIAGKLDFLKSKKTADKSILEFVDSMYQSFRSPENKQAVLGVLKQLRPDASDTELEEQYAQTYNIPLMEKAIEETSAYLPVKEINMEEISNFHALKGTFTVETKEKTFSDLVAEKYSKQDTFKESIDKIRSDYHIKEITYLSKLKLISSCIGTINGPTHSDKPDFVAHFNPLWDSTDRNSLHIYSYPYETEGLLIEFDKNKLLQWLSSVTGKEYSLTPEELLLKIKEDSDEYKHLYTLLHTLSHVLIKKSSLYTGIDTDSCGEMIFVTSGAFLIYATNTINIGGFGSVFENSIIDLFTEADLEIRRCIYDPVCLKESGGCFSCLFLPEHVCCNFNNLLDRDILLGSARRYKERFW